MLNIAICDDDEIFIVELHKIIKKILKSLQVDFRISDYIRVKDIRLELEEGTRFDVMLLDIEFANDTNNGVYLGNYIRDELHIESTQIIYISSKQGYAMELFHSRPFDFISKPIDINKITDDFKRIIAIGKIKKETFSFKNSNTTTHLEISSILYLQSDNHKVYIYCYDNTTYSYNGKLPDAYNQLKCKNFFSPHKSFLVNYYAVKSWGRNAIVLINGTVIPVSRSHIENVSSIQLQNET